MQMGVHKGNKHMDKDMVDSKVLSKMVGSKVAYEVLFHSKIGGSKVVYKRVYTVYKIYSHKPVVACKAFALGKKLDIDKVFDIGKFFGMNKHYILEHKMVY